MGLRSWIKQRLNSGPAPETAEALPPSPLERCRLMDLATARPLVKKGHPRVLHFWGLAHPGSAEDSHPLLELCLSQSQDIDFIGINWDLVLRPGRGIVEVGRQVDEFHRHYGLPYSSMILQGDPGPFCALFGVDWPPPLPQTLVIDHLGQRRYHHQGPLGDAQLLPLEGLLERIAAEASGQPIMAMRRAGFTGD